MLQSARPVGWRALGFTDPHRSTARPKEEGSSLALAARASTRAGAVTCRAARLGSSVLYGSRLAGAAWSRLRIGASDFGRLGPDVLPGRSCPPHVSDDDALSPSSDKSEHLQEKDIESLNEILRAFYEFWGPIIDPPKPQSCSSPSDDIIDPIPDDGNVVTEKDLESDEALWALYERWCKAFNKERDHAEMVRRFPEFKLTATIANNWNTYVPEDPRRAATFLKGKREAELRMAKGLRVPYCYVPMVLGPCADGEDQEMGSPDSAAY